VCREVAYQIITGGIGKELKAVQKKFWPAFPVQIGRFSLLNFGHSKVEVAALEDIKLVDVELRRHDPYQIVGNHLAHCNMKTYEHEDSPCDDIFKGARAYEEILDRVQALPPDLQANFLAFQKHRRAGLPKILQGESTNPPSEQESIPPGFELKSLDKRTTEENPKNSEVPSQRSETSQTEHPGSETDSKSETPLKPNQMIPPSSSTIPVDTPKTTEGTQLTELGSPITTLTPLQSTFGTPHLEVMYISELTPISIEEIPSSDFFFSRKRKVVVKQEMHLKEGTMVKKHRVLVDGQNLEDEDFATEVAGSLGAFAMTNLFSVDNLKARLKQRNQMIAQLQSQIRNTEKNIRDEINKGLEQARAADKQEIQLLKSSLDEMYKKMQASQGQVIKQEELVKQLQDKLSSTESQVVNITIFQAQALEVHQKLEAEQQSLFSKVEIIQNYFRDVSQSLENIAFKEKEATTARAAFQKAVVFSAKEEVPVTPKLTVAEQIRGDIMLKVWEANISESRKMAKEIKEECEETFDLLDKKLLDIGKGDCPGLLGQINVIRHQLNLKESLHEAQVEISQLIQVNVAQMDKWLVKPNLQLQSVKFEDKRIEDRLSKIQRKLYLFEAKDASEPSQRLAQFIRRCVECFEPSEASTSKK
jgi:hypothetical protein